MRANLRCVPLRLLLVFREATGCLSGFGGLHFPRSRIANPISQEFLSFSPSFSLIERGGPCSAFRWRRAGALGRAAGDPTPGGFSLSDDLSLRFSTRWPDWSPTARLDEHRLSDNTMGLVCAFGE